MTTPPNHIRTLVVDDEPPARELIVRLLRDETDVEVIGQCASGREAVAAIERENPDLVFLDVQMPELDGFGVLATARPATRPVVVFVTAYDRHAVKAFEVHAVDYLLKPFEYDRLRSTLERVRSRLSQEPGTTDLETQLAGLLDNVHARAGGWDRIAVRDQKRTVFIRPAEIDWVAAEGNYVRLHTGKVSHLHRETLAALEERLSPRGFVRVSRSALVNLDRVREWRPLFHGDSVLVLDDGREVAASRTYRESLEKRLHGGVSGAAGK